ncbi:MAG: hypothetical protein AAF492_28745, partial [Verrucomicrobiota bacterium]
MDYTAVADGPLRDGVTWGNTSPGVEGVDFPDNTTPDLIRVISGPAYTITDDLPVDAGFSQKTIRMDSGNWNRNGPRHSFSIGVFELGDCKGNFDAAMNWNGTVAASDLVLETVPSGASGTRFIINCDGVLNMSRAGGPATADFVIGGGSGPEGNVAAYVTVDGGRLFFQDDATDLVFNGDNASTLILTNDAAAVVSLGGNSDLFINGGGGTIHIYDGTFSMDELILLTDIGAQSRFNLIVEGSEPNSITFNRILTDFAGQNTGEGTFRFNLDDMGVTPIALAGFFPFDKEQDFSEAIILSVQEGMGFDGSFTQHVALLDFNGGYLASNIAGIVDFNVDGNVYTNVVGGTVVTMSTASVDLEFRVRFDDQRPGANSEELWLEFIP